MGLKEGWATENRPMELRVDQVRGCTAMIKYRLARGVRGGALDVDGWVGG